MFGAWIGAVFERAEIIGATEDAFRKQESGRELPVRARCPHDDGKGLIVKPDFERLFRGRLIGAELADAFPHAGDIHGAKGVGHAADCTGVRFSGGIGVATAFRVRKRERHFGQQIESLSELVTSWTGTTSAFLIAVLVIVVWVVIGQWFHYSDTWQLVINTGTTIITFLMVFLIQRSQNKTALAINLKLNEIVAAIKGASNRLIEAEGLSEEDLKKLERHYAALAKLARRSQDLTESHSIEEAHGRHSAKSDADRRRVANE